MSNAVLVNFANGENSEITVTNLEINDAHKQWESLNEISQSKILTAHEVVSPMLFGVKDSSGFSSNADELAESERQTIERVVQPKQDSITDAFEEILQTDDITGLYQIAGYLEPSNFTKFTKAVKASDYEKCVRIIHEDPHFSGRNFLYQLLDWTLSDSSISKKVLPNILEGIAEIDFRLTMGSERKLQLESLID